MLRRNTISLMLFICFGLFGSVCPMEKQTKKFSDIPDDVIFLEILTFFNVNDLIKMKSVSRSWSETITEVLEKHKYIPLAITVPQKHCFLPKYKKNRKAFLKFLTGASSPIYISFPHKNGNGPTIKVESYESKCNIVQDLDRMSEDWWKNKRNEAKESGRELFIRSFNVIPVTLLIVGVNMVALGLWMKKNPIKINVKSILKGYRCYLRNNFTIAIPSACIFNAITSRGYRTNVREFFSKLYSYAINSCGGERLQEEKK